MRGEGQRPSPGRPKYLRARALSSREGDPRAEWPIRGAPRTGSSRAPDRPSGGNGPKTCETSPALTCTAPSVVCRPSRLPSGPAPCGRQPAGRTAGGPHRPDPAPALWAGVSFGRASRPERGAVCSCAAKRSCKCRPLPLFLRLILCGTGARDDTHQILFPVPVSMSRARRDAPLHVILSAVLLLRIHHPR